MNKTLKLMAGQPWGFHNPVKLNVGRGVRVKLADKLNGCNLLVVSSKRGSLQFADDSILQRIIKNNRIKWVDDVTENPTLEFLQEKIDEISSNKFDAIIAFGGGSAMDAAKAINLGLHCKLKDHDLLTILEEPELHADITQGTLYSIPTTSGTGSEATPFATVWHDKYKKKLSLSGDAVFSTEIFVDPAMTDTVPLSATVSTGLDAINQAAESIWNKNANPVSLAYATQALKLGLGALTELANAIKAGDSRPELRDNMANASLLAGLAISHTMTALCHSISYPLTAHFNVPHGLACAFTMPAVLRHNLQADDGRFKDLSISLLGTDDTNELVTIFDELNSELEVNQQIKKYVPNLDALIDLHDEMFTPSRVANNLAKVDDLYEILKFSWANA